MLQPGQFQEDSKPSLFTSTTVHLLAQLLTMLCGLVLVSYGAITGNNLAIQVGGGAVAASSLIAWKP